MCYSTQIIGRATIENESSGPRGLTVEVSIDSLEKVTIVLGNGMTIRTGEDGIDDLSSLLSNADQMIRAARANREFNDMMDTLDHDDRIHNARVAAVTVPGDK
jgi:hypothetical protein